MRPYGFTRKTLVPLASAMTLAAATTVGALAAPKETVLYSFKAGTSDGAYPSQDVIRDSQGNIYGMTQEGGALNAGVVYKVAPDGTETVLHSFVGGANDGSSPNGAPRSTSTATSMARRSMAARRIRAWCSSSRRTES